MTFEPAGIDGCFVIEPQLISDERGWFGRVFCEKEMMPFVGAVKFTQINHSFNVKKGTFRGMHYQAAPYNESKLIRCISGSIMDFVLDLRQSSPTLLKWIKVELSAANHKMLYIPKGCAHGFQTLEDNTEILYHHTSFYNREADRGVSYCDPQVGIQLPLEISTISEKDNSYVFLKTNFGGINV